MLVSRVKIQPPQPQQLRVKYRPHLLRARKVPTLRWVKPSNGAVLQGYNLANNVKGIRYAGNQGDPIYAAADGQVVYAADGLKEYGNLILIKHIDGYITAYAHNSAMNVKSGQKCDGRAENCEKWAPQVQHAPC